MIFGIGCDLCATARIERVFHKESGAHFAQRVFSPAEHAALLPPGEWVEFSTLSPKVVESFAANFAAKEAFLKATGTGISGFPLSEIAAMRHDSGAPYYVFTGTAAEYIATNHLRAHLSLSHENGLAMAYCILEQEVLL